MILAIGSDDK